MQYKEKPPLGGDLFLGMSCFTRCALNWQETILVTFAYAHNLWLSAYLLARLLALPREVLPGSKAWAHLTHTGPCTTLFKLNRRELDGFVADQGCNHHLGSIHPFLNTQRGWQAPLLPTAPSGSSYWKYSGLGWLWEGRNSHLCSCGCARQAKFRFTRSRDASRSKIL